MAHHFRCTACGLCCYGQLPLTIDDAFRHAGRFPLALVWTPIRQGSKDFDRVASVGAVFTLPNRKQLASLIVPSAYLPPSFPCPELTSEKLCAIHADKPLRCKTMPFYPYRDEAFQAELLKPQPGWLCDTSSEAPMVFDQQRIIDHTDFDQEAQALQTQHRQIVRYAEYMLKYTPNLLNNLAKAAAKAKARQVETSLSSFLTALRHPDAKNIAEQQLPVLEHYLAQTAQQLNLAEFHQYYQTAAKEMRYLASR